MGQHSIRNRSEWDARWISKEKFTRIKIEQICKNLSFILNDLYIFFIIHTIQKNLQQSAYTHIKRLKLMQTRSEVYSEYDRHICILNSLASFKYRKSRILFFMMCIVSLRLLWMYPWTICTLTQNKIHILYISIISFPLYYNTTQGWHLTVTHIIPIM